MRRTLPAIAALLAAACSGKPDPAGSPAPSAGAGPGEAGEKSEPKPTSEPPSGEAKRGPKPPREPAVSRETIEALFEAWLAAQNGGDFAAYARLYGADFRGVRRSGRKAVQLDRAGWLRDRERMFRKPMKVTATRREIAVGRSGAEIHIIQDWASGRYRDVGPKIIVVRIAPDGPRIVREEMLSSTMVNAPAALPAASPQFALLYKGGVVVDSSPDPIAGPAKLVAGTYPRPSSDCGEDPPDYESEQDRYWACKAAQPENHVETYVATRAVTGASAGASWLGRRVALHGNSGPLCESTITSLSLRAEWLAHAADVGKNGERDRDLAATVLDEANPVLLGQLAAGCAGALFARDPSLPDPPRWAIAAAPPAVAAAAEAELASVQEANGHADWAVPPKKTFLEIAPAAGGGRWVAALLQGAETCHEDTFVAVVWRWSDDPAGRAQVFAYRDRAFAITAAADFTGDGIPELVLDDGLLIWDPGRAEYGRLAIVDFRREVIDACHCECE